MSGVSQTFGFKKGIKVVLSLLWKLPLCGIAFFAGLIVSGMLVPRLGLESPATPAGTDPNTIALWFLAGSMLVALGLGLVAQRLSGGWLKRWLILSWLAWATGAASMALDALLFMETGATQSISSLAFTLLNFVLPFLALSAVVAATFRPLPGKDEGTFRLLGPGWPWRIGAVLLAYPLIYLFFGKLVEPVIREYYMTGQFELTTPGWGQIIPVQIVRSLVFLAACLPVLASWRGSRRGLLIALGIALTLLVGFMPVLASYWFPWQLRVFHGLEILADSFVYAAVLIWLLWPDQARKLEAAAQPG